MTAGIPGTLALDLRGTLQQSLNDLVKVKQCLPGVNVRETERAVGILDRLSEEMVKAAAMTRDLSGRPSDQTGHVFAAASSSKVCCGSRRSA